jgi:hypothetical protein
MLMSSSPSWKNLHKLTNTHSSAQRNGEVLCFYTFRHQVWYRTCSSIKLMEKIINPNPQFDKFFIFSSLQAAVLGIIGFYPKKDVS